MSSVVTITSEASSTSGGSWIRFVLAVAMVIRTVTAAKAIELRDQSLHCE